MESCPAQLTERVISLASRKAFDIEHLGEQSAIALTNPEENRPDSVATYAPNITEILVAPGEEPDPYEPAPGLALPAVHEAVDANGKKKKVRKRVGGSGLWHQVPAFWTAPTAARKLTAKQLAERAQVATATAAAAEGIEPAVVQSAQGSASDIRPGSSGEAAVLPDAKPAFAASRYPEYDVPADAVIVRVNHKATRTGITDVPVCIRPGENTRKMFDEMDKARHADLWRVLVALSIRRLGPPTARLIASAMGSLGAIENATVEDLTAIDGVGPEIAESVVNWFAAAREPGDWRGETLRAWQAAGVGVDVAETKKTDYVVVGENAGSKAAKAEELGIPMLSEAQFAQLLENGSI